MHALVAEPAAQLMINPRMSTLEFLELFYSGRQLTRGRKRVHATEASQGRPYDRAYVLCKLVPRDDLRDVQHVRELPGRRVDTIRDHLDEIVRHSDTHHAYFMPNGFRRTGLRDGRPMTGFSYDEAEVRWCNAITGDIDGLRDDWAAALQSDPAAFWARLYELVCYFYGGDVATVMVSTSPGHVQVHVLLDPAWVQGERHERTRITAKNVSKAFGAYLRGWGLGADPAAEGNIVQPFRLPGYSRPDQPYVVSVGAMSTGPRASLWTLLRRAHDLGLIQADVRRPFVPGQERPEPSSVPGRGEDLLQAVLSGHAAGVVYGCRNVTAYRLRVALQTAGHDVADEALEIWNSRCEPPLPPGEIRRIKKSARRRRRPLSRAHWEELMEALGLSAQYPVMAHLAKPLAERQRLHFAETARFLLSAVAEIDGYSTQVELLARDLGVKTRSLRLVMRRLEDEGVLLVDRRPGRNGGVTLRVVDRQNLHNAIALLSKRCGGWVGAPEADADTAGSVVEASPAQGASDASGVCTEPSVAASCAPAGAGAGGEVVVPVGGPSFAGGRQWAAWEAVRSRVISAAELAWLVDSLLAVEWLVSLLRMAERHRLARLSLEHAVVLRLALQRLRVLSQATGINREVAAALDGSSG